MCRSVTWMRIGGAEAGGRRGLPPSLSARSAASSSSHGDVAVAGDAERGAPGDRLAGEELTKMASHEGFDRDEGIAFIGLHGNEAGQILGHRNEDIAARAVFHALQACRDDESEGRDVRWRPSGSIASGVRIGKMISEK